MNTVLILGASGNFGSHAAAAFTRAGWQVRRYKRGGDIAAAALGVDVVVNAMNPPGYRNWAKFQPEIAALGLKAARVSGATLLVPGNVYNFGTAAAPWGVNTPQRPQTRKGRIRVAMEQSLRDATDVQVIILRGGDFIADGGGQGVFGLVVAKQLGKGVVTAMGDMNAAHAYAYLPDMARAAVELAAARASLPRFADIPFAGHRLSIRQIADTYAALLNRSMRIKPFGWWMLRLASPFMVLARELLEMRYLASHPHWMENTELRRYLPDFKPTTTEAMLSAAMPASLAPHPARPADARS
ncbi:epimerase [Abyssibius alkaniclasticus]|uniref:epimerase n=1 Tax=Abyssibius alkaniclasticus TaxID=2881234 RepID=UPI0040588038